MSLALAGCLGSSRPARFYTLEPLQLRDRPGLGSNRDVVAVSLSRFDGIPGKSVALQARWELIAQSGGKEASSLGVKEAAVAEEIDGPGHDALVAAMQRALVRFGQQVGDTVAATKVP